jgi:hypothetical protein
MRTVRSFKTPSHAVAGVEPARFAVACFVRVAIQTAVDDGSRSVSVNTV